MFIEEHPSVSGPRQSDPCCSRVTVLPPHFLKLQDGLGLSCRFPATALKTAISPKSPHSFYSRLVLEIKIWASDVLISSGVCL